MRSGSETAKKSASTDSPIACSAQATILQTDAAPRQPVQDEPEPYPDRRGNPPADRCSSGWPQRPLTEAGLLQALSRQILVVTGQMAERQQVVDVVVGLSYKAPLSQIEG